MRITNFRKRVAHFSTLGKNVCTYIYICTRYVIARVCHFRFILSSMASFEMKGTRRGASPRVYRPFLRQCVRTQPNEQAPTHGADKKEEESPPSLSRPRRTVSFSITSGIRWGRWRYVEDRRRGGQARWVASERARRSGVAGGCARGRAPEGGTREGIDAIDVFT